MKSRSPRHDGVALIITLAMIAMMTFLVVAFFSRSLTNLQVETASTGTIRADLLARSASEIVVSDFRTEIIAGSTVVGSSTQAPIYLPKTPAAAVPSLSRYAFNVPAPFVNLVKQSTGRFFLDVAPYNLNPNAVPIIQTVTPTPTDTMSPNGRTVVGSRWDLAPSPYIPGQTYPLYPTGLGPQLVLNNSPAITYSHYYSSDLLPHWIMMTRDGVPASQTATTIPANWKDYTPTNTSAAIGRFAYNIYNVGGLIDVNAAGYDESPASVVPLTAVGQKGSPLLAKLSVLPGITSNTNAALFAKTWRSAASGSSTDNYLAFLGFPKNGNTSLTANPFFLAGTKTGFLQAAVSTTSSDNRVLGRQDLIRLAVKYNSPYGLSAAALPFLTHFSREVNAPSWSPTQDATAMGASSNGTGTPAPYAYLTNKDNAAVANRFFPNVRVGPNSGATAWRRLTGELAVEGEPLVKYRFPLSWLAVLQDKDPTTTAWELTDEATAIVTALDLRNIANGGPGLTGTTTSQKAAWMVFKAFGLVWDPTDSTVHTPLYPANLGSHWNYIGSGVNGTNINPGQPVATRIALLGDSATIPAVTTPASPAPVTRDKREANFFELLKAGMLSGSLGNASDYESMCVTVGEDSFSDYQVMQIGANIIDQADSDSYPTKIIFGTRFDNPPAIQTARTPDYGPGNAPAQINEAKLICGVEDLPYIYTFLSTPYRIPAGQNDLNQDLPSPDPNPPYAKVQNAKQDMLDCWLQFVMWKPHQPPVTAPATTMKFRITFNGSYLFLYYYKDNVTFRGVDFGSAATGNTAPVLTSATVNFDDSADFRAPTVLGGMGGSPLHNFTVTQAVAPAPATVPLPRGMWMGEMYRPEKDPSDTNYANAPAVIHTEFRAKEDVRIDLQYQDAGGGWRTYQRYDRFAGGTGSFTYGGRTTYGYADNISNMRNMIGPSSADWGSPPYYRRLDVSNLAISAIDPRSHRYGLLAHYRDYVNGTTPSMLPGGDWTRYLKQGWAPEATTPYSMCFGPSSSPARFFPNWSGGPSVNPWASHSGDNCIQDPTSFWADNTTTSNSTQSTPAAPAYYLDMDGIERRGDGDSVTTPTSNVRPMQLASGTTANTQDLGRILNRPFRSVGELGYVFRDEPYKSLNLFTDKSADSALLDLFSVTEQPAIVAGKVNLNSKNAEVLQAVIVAASREEQSTTNTISTSDALTIAQRLVANTGAAPGTNLGPLLNPADIASRLATIMPLDTTTADTKANTAIKARREVVGRALAGSGQTRTWNFLVDIIAQSGRFPPSASAPAQFVVEGEKRYWLHVAIDRYTGQVIDQQFEPVME